MAIDAEKCLRKLNSLGSQIDALLKQKLIGGSTPALVAEYNDLVASLDVSDAVAKYEKKALEFTLALVKLQMDASTVTTNPVTLNVTGVPPSKPDLPKEKPISHDGREIGRAHV